MRAVIFLFEKMSGFGSGPALMICLLFLLLLSCKEDKPEQGLTDMGDTKPVSTAEWEKITSIIYYGPETFTLVSREPVIAIRSLANQNFAYLEKFVLKVQNGNTDNTRVNKIEILIDGVLMVNHSDFSGDNHFVTKQLSGITSNSILEVRLDGSKGKFVNILVDASLKQATMTAIDNSK